MSFTSGPFTPVAGVPFNVTNPAAGAGNLSSAAAVIVNLSSNELVIASGAGQTTGLIDPFTRDIVMLSSDAGQEITIDPLNIGFTGPIGINPLIYVIWYLPGEVLPAALPAPIVPYGNLQSVSIPAGVFLVPPTSSGVAGENKKRANTIVNATGGTALLGNPPAGSVFRLHYFRMWLVSPAAGQGYVQANIEDVSGDAIAIQLNGSAGALVVVADFGESGMALNAAANGIHTDVSAAVNYCQLAIWTLTAS